MKNFDKSVIDKIKADSVSLYNTFNQSDKWVDRHLKYEERYSMLESIKKNRSEIRKVGNTVASKPVFALFGVSQVGKSYLVKNLLSLNGGALEILCGDHTLDFLQKINPQGGGAESTGVVTRFSSEKTGLNNEFPIRLRLLTPKDLVILLCDSFYSDLKRMDSYPSHDQFQLIANQFKQDYIGKTQKQNNFIEDDIWDIRSYFSRNFHKFSHYVKHIEQSGFWTIVGEIIAHVPMEKWSSLLSILWDNNAHLTKVFDLLVNELNKLDFETQLFVPEIAILRDKGAILDVQRLKGIFEVNDEIDVSKNDGQKLKVSTSRLSALTAELTLNVIEEVAEAKPFLKQTDLLDFPGARGRLEWNLTDINENSVVEMFLRGKISYLFNKYSNDMEINNLMFCMKDEQIEVNELSSMLYDWIKSNIGENAEIREKNIGKLPTSPLFIVLSFFNRQLKFDSINDVDGNNQNSIKRWDNRFVRFFENQIASKYNWHKEWTITNPAFSNFYLLRDFHFSDDTFDGYHQSGAELLIRPDRIEHWNRLKDSFLNFPFVKLHLKSPEKSWDEAALPTKDGSGLIINDLEPAANNFIKIKNLTEKLETKRLSLISDLSKHHISDNIKDKRDKAFQLGVDIQFGLLNMFNSPNFHFGEFLKTMSLRDTEVFNFIHENFLLSTKSDDLNHYAIFRSMFPGISEDNSRKENLQIIASYLNMTTDEDVENYLIEKQLDLDKALENKVVSSATKLVDGVIELWQSKLNIAHFDAFMKLGMDLKTFENLTQNLVRTFDMLNFRQELIKIFEQKTRRVFSPMDTEEYLASISTSYINDFVSNFGYNFMQKERLFELEQLCADYKMDLSIINRHSVSENAMSSLSAIYDGNEIDGTIHTPLIDNFNGYITKVKLALLSNCGFVNYDINANNELNTLIAELNKINFTVE